MSEMWDEQTAKKIRENWTPAAPCVQRELALLYGGMSPEYVANMEKHRNVLADALAEIKAASECDDLERIKEVVAGCILEIRAI